MLKLRRFSSRPADWDTLIRAYDTKTLFHESAWLDHMHSIHPSGRVDYYEILENGRRVGLHCGLRITKLGLPIHGSPLGGTGTNFLGPLVQRDVDQRDLARGLAAAIGLRFGMHLELSHFELDPEIMVEEGFQRHDDVTHLIPLGDSEEDVWGALKSTCRNRVRKARKNNLVIQRIDDVSIADRFFEQFQEVYGKQGMRTPFGPDRARSLFEHLSPAGRLLALEILHEGESIATGLFPFDEKCIYFWGAASWLRHQRLCPNELLHWEVIAFAVGRGIPMYNMCGGQSQFKDKFGGEDVPYLHFSRSALPGLGAARSVYRKLHFLGLRVARKGHG
jgi:hypothetical protein